MVALPDTKTLQLEFDGGWLTIWFNTPENRNALSSELCAELLAVLNQVRGETKVRGITLRGKNATFCSGGDLKEFSAAFHANAETADIVKKSNMKGGELFSTIDTMPQVVLALIEGVAIAGGLGMACCADVVFVTEDAKFSLTETQLGIVPAQIAPYIAQRLGYTTARKLMLTGANFSGKESKALGLADEVASDATTLKNLEIELKSSVKKCAPMANSKTKALLKESQIRAPDELRTYAADVFTSCMVSEEGREGISAFIEKRKPRWAI